MPQRCVPLNNLAERHRNPTPLPSSVPARVWRDRSKLAFLLLYLHSDQGKESGRESINAGAMVHTMSRAYAEGKRMLRNFFAGLFRKRCPLCKQEVQPQGSAAVQRLGKWYCSTLHADLYELALYEALRTLQCRHTGCHGAHGPLPEDGDMNLSLKQDAEAAGVRTNHEG
jgi:hypothetical protein